MPNVQLVDGAENCTYDVYFIAEDGFRKLFPRGTDIAFVKDIYKRLGKSDAEAVLKQLWLTRVDKKTAAGIHGTLFINLDSRKKYFPTRKEAEMITGFETG